MAKETQESGAASELAGQPAGASPVAPPTAANFDYSDWWSFAVTTAVAFAGYWFTMAPNLTLEFSGLMSTGAMYAGVPHPPGYPVWTIYSWLFTKLLPFSNIAWRVAVGSAFASALACGLVALIISHQGKSFPRATQLGESNALRAACGGVAGLVFAFSGAVWRSAVIADIWALSLLLFTGALFLLTRWMLVTERRRYLLGAFFLVGVLLTNSQELIAALPGLACIGLLGHAKLGRDLCLIVLPMALLGTARSQFGIWLDSYMTYLNGPLLAGVVVVGVIAAVVSVRTRELGSEWRSVLAIGLCLLLGLAFYFYVPIASMTNPPVNWGYPRTVEGFEHVIARGQYERIRPTSDFVLFFEQLWMYVRVAGREFGWLPCVIALLPILLLRRLTEASRRLVLGLLAVFLGVGPLLLAMLNPADDFESVRLIMKPYFATSYVTLAVSFGLGLILIGDLALGSRRGSARFGVRC